PQEWEIMLRLAGALVGTPLPEVDVRAMDDLYTQGIIYTACQAQHDLPLLRPVRRGWNGGIGPFHACCKGIHPIEVVAVRAL
ncbi:hypothetical protein C6A85_15210, partial [Mycobacterium sp. ITM-2017-0098]